MDNFSNEEFTMLAKTYHYRQERLTVGLRYQIQLQEQGAALLKLLESTLNQLF